MPDPIDIDHNGLEVLGRTESFRLIERATIGRIGVNIDDRPAVLPVNFVAEADRILVRTSAGAKLTAALQHADVAFEIDDFDPIYHTGWSVLVIGTASEIAEPDELSPQTRTRLARWAPNAGHHVIEILIEQISGRRIAGNRR